LDSNPREQAYEPISLEVFFRESKIGDPNPKWLGLSVIAFVLVVAVALAQLLHRRKFVIIVDPTSTGTPNLQLGYRCHHRTINPSQRILRNVG
jgi:hypothetical protein